MFDSADEKFVSRLYGTQRTTSKFNINPGEIHVMSTPSKVLRESWGR